MLDFIGNNHLFVHFKSVNKISALNLIKYFIANQEAYKMVDYRVWALILRLRYGVFDSQGTYFSFNLETSLGQIRFGPFLEISYKR